MKSRSITPLFHALVDCAVLVAVMSGQCWPQADAAAEVCQLSGHCFGISHELTEHIVVRMAEGDIRISSTLPDGPLRGATVEVFGPWPLTARHSAETDARGHFKIKGAPPGNYGLHVWASGFNSVTGKLTISEKAERKTKLHIEMTLGV